MLFEGTSKYFWILFLILILVYITEKVSMAFIFKKVRINSLKAYIPFKNRLDLTSAIGASKKIAFMSYIPFLGLKYKKQILEVLLKGFSLDSKEAILFLILPMYKYPELVFKNVKFVQNDYSLTEMFLESENALYGGNNSSVAIPENVTTNPDSSFNNQVSENSQETSEIQIPNNIGYDQNMVLTNGQSSNDSVFTNQDLVPDEHHETYVEAPKEEVKEEKPIITPLDTGRPKLCPKCGTKLSSNATTCFMCGTILN